MGVRLLPPRLYKSELANRESLRDMLLLVELDTVKNIENRTFKIYTHVQSQVLVSLRAALTRRSEASQSRAQSYAQGAAGAAEAQGGAWRWCSRCMREKGAALRRVGD